MSDRTTAADKDSVLVVRTDRIGDTILSTPLFREIKSALPESRTVFLAPPYSLPVVQGNRFVDETIRWEIQSGSDIRALAAVLRAKRFRAAILLNPEWRSCLAVFLAGIPVRTGPLSRPSSFFFLNRGIRQHRSASPLHQSELDTAFASIVTRRKAAATPLPELYLSSREREEGTRILRSALPATGKPVVGIHAGSGKSAVPWPEEHFIEAGKLFIQEGWDVVLTGNGGESAAASRIADAIGEGAHSIAGDRDLRVFFGILGALDLFLAPSTGPLHAAAALGVPVASPYPPLSSMSPGRWGPRTENGAVLVPRVECPARIRCVMEQCPHHPCMHTVHPNDLVRAALDLLSDGEA